MEELQIRGSPENHGDSGSNSPSPPPTKLQHLNENNSAFTKFLQQKVGVVSHHQTAPMPGLKNMTSLLESHLAGKKQVSSLDQDQDTCEQTQIGEMNGHIKDHHQKSRSFCIESLLKSEAKHLPAGIAAAAAVSSGDRFSLLGHHPAITPPSSNGGNSPPPSTLIPTSLHNNNNNPAMSPPIPPNGLPQFPFPPQLLPYLLPPAAAAHQQQAAAAAAAAAAAGNGGPLSSAADYVHMEYLARQGVFLNSFPGFAGNTSF